MDFQNEISGMGLFFRLQTRLAQKKAPPPWDFSRALHVSNSEELFFWALVWPRSKWKWDFFLSVKKTQSSGVPIWLLTKKKFFSHIFKHIMESPQTTFERFLMTTSSARSILVNCSPKKNLTSNGSKPIGVLTRTKISHSDLRLPNAYSLPDF